MATKKDGYGVRITLETSSLSFLETSVTPPGVDGGDGIDVTNNSKASYREMYPRTLKEITPISATVEYDPADIASIIAAINLAQDITVSFSAGDAVQVYGFLKSFTPSDQSEGEYPSADIEIIACGVDALNAEEGIVYLTTTS